MKIINLGCGGKINEAFINVDVLPMLPGVIKCDLLSGIPYPDNYFDAAYHSHVLEHFSQDDGKKFIAECYRVLKPGGILRIAVPDLENITRQYLKYLELALAGEPLAENNYDWMMLELYDQAVRTEGGGAMAKYLTQKQIINGDFVRERIGSFYDVIRKNVEEGAARKKTGLKQHIKNILPENIFLALKNKKNKLLDIFNIKAWQYYRLGKFRQRGEIHQWMYDRYSLGRLLKNTGFQNVKVQSAMDSYIKDWSGYCMDTDKNGEVYKKDSFFMEGVK
jgi:predicted SAM-dependent methyltransferase